MSSNSTLNIDSDNGRGPRFDAEISTHDVQDLSSAEGVAAFFAKLGYNTNNRTTQTPENLGITADSTSRPIRKINQIADQEGLFKVYLFELASVTIAHTRALARAFRTLTGNYLLVLTSDYDRIDFVLVERYVPSIGNGTSNIAQKQASVRPKTLTVDRRNPSRVQLRVLRRLTWTESDPFAQYEKLLSAYGVADWSEELFNNRALFSDYYLRERLRERAEWKENPKPAYLALRQLYQDATSRLAGKDEKTLRRDLIEPAFDALGHQAQAGKKASNSEADADYRLYSGKERGSPRALSLVYPWGRSLDGKDYERDTETADENPGAVVVSLLEKGEAPWAVVTNGKVWRLYSQRTHSKATNYYEIDLEEILAATGPQADPADAFRYFWLLFRASAFEPTDVLREGKTVSLSFLDQLLAESEDYAKELGERLKGRVFEEVFPHLAEGFIAYICERDGVAAGEISEDTLTRVFQGTLTLLYRLLFLLYAEARDLLPVKEVRGYWEASLKKLKHELAETAGSIEDEVSEKLNKTYRKDRFDLYDRLARLFTIIDCGDSPLNVPVYNGGLFLSQPSNDDNSPEAEAARFLNSTKTADRFLARAIDLVARDEDPKRHDLVPIDYKSLGVRHLGSIYEGLLEFKVRIAGEKLAIVKEQGREVYSSFRNLNAKDQERAERRKQVLKKGQVYLENDKRERKATGSYYTPDYIVKYIVKYAVGPVLQEKFEKLRPRLREAQRWNRDMVALARSKREPESKYDHGPAVEVKWSGLVDELFDIKVLDPAMGSGHFLVEAVDFITDKTLDFLNGFPWNPVRAHMLDMRETILRQMEEQGINIDEKRLTDVNLLKRHVLKRCIYGVDLNPMAVELAKVSLWLNCFTLGAPLSFLDHHLRNGNSLVGASVSDVVQAIETGQLSLLSGTRFQGMKQAVGGMIEVGGSPDLTAAQIRDSRLQYKQASNAMEPAKRLLDVYTSQWFGNPIEFVRRGGKKIEHNPALEFLRDRVSEDWATNPTKIKLDDPWKDIATIALEAAVEEGFFHWELEFPEVFYGARPGTNNVERLDDGGFDSVVGNPPYDVLEKERGVEEWPHEALLDFIKQNERYESARGGKINLYRPFVVQGLLLAHAKGRYSQIIPLSFMGDLSVANTRRRVLMDNVLNSISAFPQKDDPRKRIFWEAKLSTCIPVITRVKPTVEHRFNVRTYPANSFEDEPLECHPAISDLLVIDPKHIPIPICSQEELTVAVKLHRQSKRLEDVSKISRGEINQTVFRRYITDEENKKPLLKGVEVRRFGFNSRLSQGEREYFDEQLYEEEHRPKRPPQSRIAIQRITGVDESRRIVAAISRNRAYFADSTNSIISDDEKLTQVLLALLNSDLLNWRFRLTSTNNNVGTNELEVLPFPSELSQQERINEIVSSIESEADGESNSGLDDLNSLVYSLYRLDENEIEIVKRWNTR